MHTTRRMRRADRTRRTRLSLGRALLLAQGVYFALTGLWPLLDIHSFQVVTGEKTDHLPTGRDSDHWLVFTVGVVVLAIGISLFVAAWRDRMALEIAILAVLSASGLGIIDVIFVARRVISPVYLLDALAEAVLVTLWAVWFGLQLRRRTDSTEPRDSGNSI